MKKNILMIGGSRGIGLAIASQLHNSHNLYIASRTSDGLEGLNKTYIHFDATAKELDATALPEQLDGFIYLPGSINLKPLKMLPLETFEEDMRLNFFSLVKVVKTILPKLKEGASLVFFSTVAVGTGMPFHTSVAAAKGAIEGFARSLAAEYAPKLRVNVIAPSLVDTPLAGRLLNNEKKKEMMSERHPLKRFGLPDDIANTAIFLLTDKSSWMTGQVIRVDGGIGNLNVH